MSIVFGDFEPTNMHVRWNEIDAQSSAHKSRKSLNVDEREFKSEIVRNKPSNTDLFQALSPIYYLNKLWGILPVRYIKKSPGRYQGKLHIIDIVYSISLLIILVGAEIWGFYRDLKDGWENSIRLKSQTAMIATCSDVIGIMGLTCVSIIGAAFRWKQLQNVIDKLVEVDESLGIVSPKKTRRFTIIITVGILTYLSLTSMLDIYLWDKESKMGKKMSDKGPINYVPMYFMYAVILLMEVQYSIAAFNVGQRFIRLNKSLENMLNNKKITDHFRKDLGLARDLRDQGPLATAIRQDAAAFRMFRKPKILDWYTASNENRTYANNVFHLVSVHTSLCDTVSLINNAFGIVVLAITLTCLLHLIITPYFLIMEADGNREWMFIIVQGMWCILHITRVLMIVQPTYATTSESKKTAVLVSQLLSSDPEVETRKHLEIFSLQILHRPLEFSACGLFALDRTLVTSIAGAVTTYLVILIQFQKADDTKGDVDNILKNATLILKNASSLHSITSQKPSS
ncbi:hypothetical protein KM043_012544 [Ampulex compressa]|nr:hypothetical protein KM043_012544 [Ampulex compressa]